MTQLQPHEIDTVALLEQRTRVRRKELNRSLETLQVAVKSSLPTHALDEAVDDRPYQSVLLAFGVGCLIGSIL